MSVDTVTCENCGAANSPENDYCAACGQPMTEPTERALRPRGGTPDDDEPAPRSPDEEPLA